MQKNEGFVKDGARRNKAKNLRIRDLSVIILYMPTVFIDGNRRYYFFSREETRMHVHVSTPGGEAKIWLEPEISVAKAINLPESELNEIIKTVANRKEDLINAWNKHFGKN